MGDTVDTKAKAEPFRTGRSPGDALRGGVLGDKLGDPLARSAVVQGNGGALSAPAVSGVAAGGVSGAGGALPHRGSIQSSFGHHDISGVQAHTGPEARAATDSLGTTAYATGNDVALATNDLHTVAHEAAHVVQQQQGVQLKGGISSAGDPYERHADAVADAVVAGQSAEGLLDASPGGGGGSGGAVQLSGGSASVAPAPALGGAAPVATPAPTIRSGGTADAITVGGDAATALQGAGAVGVKGATMLGSLSGGAMEAVGAAGEMLGWVGVGLGVFSIAENLVRGRDARIRLGAFTRAWSNLPPGDPIKAYLQDAAKQQQWESTRRWVRVAISTIVLGLSMAALIVGTGGVAGIVMAAVAGVLAIVKGIETIRNFFQKRAARKRQEEIAREMLTEALSPSATEERRGPIVEMLTGLGIAVPQRIRDGRGQYTAEFTDAASKLAPHLSRADDVHKVNMQEQADQFFVNVMAEADAAIAAAGPEPAPRPQIT